MTIPLDAWIKAKNFRSQDAFARELYKQVPDAFSDSPEAKRHRLLGNQLSRLKKGETSWWRKHLATAAAAAELLGVPVERLLGTGKSTEVEEQISFPEFPALRPLDALREPPLKKAGELKFVGDPDLSGFSRDLFSFPYSGLTWIQAPPGAGKSLAFRYQQIRTEQKARAVPDRPFLQAGGFTPRVGPDRFLQVRRLADVLLEGAAPSWLIIDLAQQDPASDAETLRDLARYRHVVVLAPFARPGAAEEPPLKSLQEDQQDAAKESRWLDYRWHPESGWRELLIQWVADRLGGERRAFEPHEFIQWLRELDTDGRLIQTPGELLMLCALAHEQGTRRLRKRFADGWKDITREWISGILGREAQGDTTGAAWLRATGAHAVRALASAAWRSGRPWPPRESNPSWAELLPGQFHAPPPDQRLDEMLDALVRESSRKRRAQKAQQVKAPLRTLSPLMAIDYLAATHLLRVSGDGLALHPRWMADSLAREFVEDALALSPADWGLWAARPDRRQVVEIALEAVSFSRLVTIAERAVKEFDPSSLGAVGATDTLFTLLGRRLPGEQATEREAAVLHGLARCHLGSLIPRYSGSLPVPVTRPGFGEASFTWLADCWTWSFSLPAPAWEVPAEFKWAFPGWTRPTLGGEGPKSILDTLYPRGRREFPLFPVTPEPDPEFSRLLQWTGKIIEACVRESFPLHVPSVLLPAALAWAAQQGIEVDPGQMEPLFNSEWQPAYLTRLIDEAPVGEVQVRLCDMVWRSMVRRMQGVLSALSGRWSQEEALLLKRVTKGVSPEAVRRTVSETGPGVARHVLEGIAPRLLLVVVEALAETSRGRPFDIEVSDLGAEYLEVFELIVRHSKLSTSARAALWRFAPERALILCKELLDDSQEAALGLFWSAPLEAHASLFSMLEERDAAPVQPPEWLPRWLAQCILKGSPLMEQAWQLRARLVTLEKVELGEKTPGAV